MAGLVCRKATELTTGEKRVFADHLVREALSENIWDLFGEWIDRGTPEVSFFYLKVFSGEKLVGLGMLLRINPFDLRASYSRLREPGVLKTLGGLISRVSSNSVIVSFRNLITSNHTRPFFFREPDVERAAMQAMLTYLKADAEADMVTIVDTSCHSEFYREAGFDEFPSSSEAWFDVREYREVSEYLARHRSLANNLKRRRNRISVEVRQQALSAVELEQAKSCVGCSVEHSMVQNPCQRFFEENIFSTEVFRSSRYVHILVRVDGLIAGFHTFQVSGLSMGGVLGGFNRKHSRNHFVYERVIIASLDYAIKNQLRRVHYSLVDNHTKLRLIDFLEPCGLYFFSKNPVNRAVFRRTFRYNDVYALSQLERQDPRSDRSARLRSPGDT